MNRRAFALLELLFVLALLGVFALMATRLFYASVAVMRTAALSTESAMRFDSAMAAMRHDVFLSDSIQMLNPDSLEVHRPGGAVIQWETTGNELDRTADNTHHHWDVGQKIELRLQGNILLVRPSVGGELAMASALEIAK
jgi:prepilin-type N-terminal cleavage/methylation domain-containing protein